ncbi:pimeloyl-ACP methyl ester carboxylesterase [Arthrobacter ginsengisoli]|uniref:Pimeloyl-ACP methyl ester carboxylesterase n=1 Tax=Arthrobacter ginsengisoli TaxID=1356565 RepID=A0ABU1U877_9MICC|nr:alpha/beta fold hydrolase [Arthrobacter ginsengisoli]MDR7081396.1 pimeloyl-ACP methyl ester carboxylesterase [Arthrobacter ginsengisoli]
MAIRKIDDREPQPAGPGADAMAVLSIAGASGVTRGVVLVLHGGRSNSYEAVRGGHLSPARMLPFARALRSVGGPDGLAVWTLRNRYRGWNGKDMSPVQDARWALSHISREHPGVPIFLLGHSMGGLTALCVADHPEVQAVVALAPWLDAKTPVKPLAGRRILIVHGTGDRWTSPANSLAYARRAHGVAESVEYVALKGAGHFMVRRVGLWNSLANGFILEAFARSTGRELRGSPDTFRSLVPSSGAGLPVVL